MARKQTRGTCIYCGKDLAKSGMAKHLPTCEQRKAAMQEPLGPQHGKPTGMPLYHIQVEGTYAPMYWMHLEVPGDFTLGHLDQFLRDTWLECCGHMSAYRIGGSAYYSHPWERGQKGMGSKLKDVLEPGIQLTHEYDFGTTTDLTLKVIAVREGLASGKSLAIMARNDPPVWECSECGQPAVEICTQCLYEDAGFLCKKHARNHPCGEDMLLPVVNSPRMGECGYTG